MCPFRCHPCLVLSGMFVLRSVWFPPQADRGVLSPPDATGPDRAGESLGREPIFRPGSWCPWGGLRFRWGCRGHSGTGWCAGRDSRGRREGGAPVLGLSVPPRSHCAHCAETPPTPCWGPCSGLRVAQEVVWGQGWGRGLGVKPKEAFTSSGEDPASETLCFGPGWPGL